MLLEAGPRLSAQWELVRMVELVQMVYPDDANASRTSASLAPAQISKLRSAETPTIVPLGAADSAEIVELGTLTNPGPIGSRTHEIADFLGVRADNGQLIAMAGERMRMSGYAEVSGVCTRPGFEGRGLAAALMLRVMARIRSRGEVPFLHSRADNTRAVKLYERLGFTTRRRYQLAVLRNISG